MSPRESAVKLGNLWVNHREKVNGLENEAGSHDILSRPRLGGLHML